MMKFFTRHHLVTCVTSWVLSFSFQNSEELGEAFLSIATINEELFAKIERFETFAQIASQQAFCLGRLLSETGKMENLSAALELNIENKVSLIDKKLYLSRVMIDSILFQVEKLWNVLSQTLIAGRAKLTFNTALLEDYQPLLESVLQHPNKAIVTQALQFWNSTFGECSDLTYPTSLKYAAVSYCRRRFY